MRARRFAAALALTVAAGAAAWAALGWWRGRNLGPVQRGWRIAAQDVEIGGQPIQSGALVLPMLGAANRDPARFAEPDMLDFHRFSIPGTRHEAEARHLGFGYGIHSCIGAPLARLEVPAALSGLLRRFPGMRLEPASKLRWRRDLALRGVETLPVRIP